MKDIKTWIAAIRAEVDDDIPRLAFADWLEERDQAERAEFVRVQCELARIEGDDPRRPGLTRREEELLIAREAVWKKEVPAWAAKYGQFRRGFVAHIGAGVQTFVGSARGLLARSPVTSASLSNVTRETLKTLAGCPHLAALQDLSLIDCEVDGLEPVLNSANTVGLRGLHFNALSGWAARFTALAPLFDSPQLARLTRLSIRHVGFGPADIRQFVALDAVQNLEKLRIQSDETSDAAVEELAAGEHLANLRVLGLDGSRALTDAGARALAGSPHLSNLRRLDLSQSRITDEGAKAIAASPHLEHLTDLDLMLTGVSEAGVRVLAESANLPRLARIDMLFRPELAEPFPVWRWPRPAGTLACTVWVRES